MSTQPTLSPLEQFGQTVQQQSATPSQSDLSPLEQLGQSVNRQPASQQTNTVDDGSNTRQMLVSGLTGMPTPNMTDAEKASFQKGKAAGAVSVPVVAGATAAGFAAPEVVPTIVDKAKAVAQWAKTNPIKAYVAAKMAEELGVHPFDMLHAVVKYGKNLFGSEEGK